MIGKFDPFSSKPLFDGEADEISAEAGIMPRSFTHLFSAVKNRQMKQQGVRFLIRCSFIEIYNEELRDLLAENETT